MNKLYILSIVFFLTVFTGCSKDPLFPIRRLARSKDIEQKMEASNEYKQVITILRDAYMNNAGLCKDIGRALMMNHQYDNALIYFEEAVKTRTTDSTLYYWMAICYVNKYKVDHGAANRALVYENYEKSLNLIDNNKEVLYAFAQFLVFGDNNYERAIEVLQKNIELLGTYFVADTYFLLGRAYYMQGLYDMAYSTYNQMLSFKDKMSKQEYNRVLEFIDQTSNMLNGAAND